MKINIPDGFWEQRHRHMSELEYNLIRQAFADGHYGKDICVAFKRSESIVYLIKNCETYDKYKEERDKRLLENAKRADDNAYNKSKENND